MVKKTIIVFYQKYQKIIILSLILVVGCFAFYSWFSYMKDDNKTENNKSIKLAKPVAKESKDSNEIIKEYYYVDIKGAITTPSVYQMEKGTRVIDVIKIAGGLTEEADTSTLNLSKKISDEMVIIIYTKKQIKQLKQSNNIKTVKEISNAIKADNECPDTEFNGACISNGDSTTTNDKVSINNASSEQLQTLPGIGEAKALNIINYRQEKGLFTQIEDIKNVTGIGDSIFAKIKDYLTL